MADDPKPYVPGADGDLITADRWNAVQTEARKDIAALRDQLTALEAKLATAPEPARAWDGYIRPEHRGLVYVWGPASVLYQEGDRVFTLFSYDRTGDILHVGRPVDNVSQPSPRIRVHGSVDFDTLRGPQDLRVSTVTADNVVIGGESLGAMDARNLKASTGNYGFPTGLLQPDAYSDFSRCGGNDSYEEAGIEYGTARAHFRLNIPAGIGCFTGLLTLSSNPNPGGQANYRASSVYLISMIGGYDVPTTSVVRVLNSALLHNAVDSAVGLPAGLASLHWGHGETGSPSVNLGMAGAAFSVVMHGGYVFRRIADVPAWTLAYDHHHHISLTILHATS